MGKASKRTKPIPVPKQTAEKKNWLTAVTAHLHGKGVIASFTLSLVITGLYLTYLNNGADDLRSRVYEPLFGAMSKIEAAALSGSVQPWDGSALEKLKDNGQFQRVPGSLRQRIDSLAQGYGNLSQDFNAAAERVERTASSQIMKMRTEQSDLNWNREAGARIRRAAESGVGIPAMAAFQFKHTALGQGLDVRDSRRPIPASPGGPTLNFQDWATFPASVQSIEKMWGEDDYLYFDEIQDAWYYRVTKADLRSKNVDLSSFLRPIHAALMALPEFREALMEQSKVAVEARAVTEEIALRMQKPKQIGDILH